MGVRKHMKTENCVVCGEKATLWHGYVVGLEKYALGCGDKKVIAGFCEKHKEFNSENEDGFYGSYDSTKMGKCVPLFSQNVTA